MPDESPDLDAMLRGRRPKTSTGLARSLAMTLLQARMGLADHPMVGRYVVRAKLGQGGMGMVFSATDPLLERDVAIKVLHIDGEPEAAARMASEARTMAAVPSPYVLTVHDVGIEDDSAWIVTELVTGGTLREWVDVDGERPWRSVVERFVEAARGLASAHAQGVVHRDFKPDNVLIGDDGRARVADFGLAIPLVPDEVDEPGSSSVAGTASYLAPELLRGEPATPQSDQYAFFVSVRELVPEPVDDELDGMITRGMADDPEARWPSMAEVVVQLESLLRSPTALTPPSLLELAALAQEAPDRQAYLEQALDWVQRAVGFDTALFGRADVQGPMGPRVEGFDEALLGQFQAGAHLYAPTLMHLEAASAQERRVVTDTEVMDQRDRSRSAFHADLLGAKGTRVMAVAHLSAAGKLLGSLQISRNAAGTRFSDREQALLTQAAPLLALGLAAHDHAPTASERVLLSLWERGFDIGEISTLTGQPEALIAVQLELLGADIED